jgi:hypothetical protein
VTSDDDRPTTTPPGRVPGRYIVIGLLVVLLVVFVVSLVLAVRLEPAADRFHNRPPAPGQK